MNELSIADYSKRLKALREALSDIMKNKKDSNFLDSISEDLSELENTITFHSESFDDDVSRIQKQLDHIAELYKESCEKAKTLLYKQQIKLDNVRLLSEEELKEIRDTYSEQLLLENQCSIVLRKMIITLQQLLEKYQRNKNSKIDDIELVHFSVPIIASEKFRAILLDEKTINRISEVVLLRPEKAVMTNQQDAQSINYVPGLAPEDMVEKKDSKENKSGVKDIFCFKGSKDVLGDNNSYNIINNVSGRFLNIDKLLILLAKVRKRDNSRDISKMFNGDRLDVPVKGHSK